MKRQLRLSTYAAIAFQAASDLTPREPGPARAEGVVAVVPVVGPLEHRYSPWCSSYQGVLAMATDAFASGATAVVLDLETPGGDVVGLFDTCAALRAMADASGVPLIGFVNTAHSAGYALAAVCDEIVISSTGTAGSVGVVSSLEDHTAALEQMGIKVRLVTSGARKADGNPMQPLSDEAIATRQAQVDALALQFTTHVAERRGLDPADVVAQQAGVYIGADAVAAGLADRVESFAGMVARLQKGETMSAKAMLAKVAAAVKAGEIKPDEAMAALGLAAKTEDDEGKEPPAEAKAETAPDKTEDKPSEAKAAASSSGGLFAMLADPDFAAKAALIESRPDFTPLQQIALMGQPLTAVKAVVNFSRPAAASASVPVAANPAPAKAPAVAQQPSPALEAFAALHAGGPATVAAQAAAVEANTIEDLAKIDPTTAELMGAAFGLSRPNTKVTSYDAKTNIQYIGHVPKGATVISPTAQAK